MSIRLKLILWYSGLLAIIVVLFGVAMFSVMRWALTSTIDSTLQTTADQVRQNSRGFLIGEFGGPVQVGVHLPELDAFRLSGMLVQVWDLSSDTPTLADASMNIDDYNEPLDPGALQQVSGLGGEGEHFSNFIENGAEWRVMTQSLDIWGRRIALQIATSSQASKEATQLLLVIMAIAAAVGILGSIGLGLLLSTRTLKPIKQITAAADRIAQTDDLKTRLPWSGPQDEMGQLVSVFNRMMSRLEHLFSVQQRFVADVSHELRTPLTAIRGNLDLIRRYGMDSESLEAMESETERMSRLVTDLLLLARADYGGLTLELEPLDLDTVVSEVYREARVLAKDRNLKVTIGDFEPVKVNGHGDRIKQVMLNLVGNAIKFTPDGGQVTINLRCEDYDAVLEVDDTGIGITDEDKTRIFDRFFQAEPSRVRRKGDGFGLGLSIAKWIVDAHHGTIAVSSEVGKGTTFTIRIPALLENARVSAEAVTRPRIGIIRRSPVTQKAR